MATDLERLQVTFLEEAAEHLQDLEQGLLEVEEDPANLEPFQRVFRAAHSIKGGSGIFGFDSITRLTHALENVLDLMRKGDLEATSERIDVLLRSVDCLRTLLEEATQSESSVDELRQVLIRELNEILGTPTGPEPVAISEQPLAEGPHTYRIRFRPFPDALGEITDPLLILRNLAKRGEISRVSPDMDSVPSLEDFEPQRCYLGWEIELISQLEPDAIQDVFEFVRDHCDLEIHSLALSDPIPPAEGPSDPKNRGVHLDSSTQNEVALPRMSNELFDAMLDLLDAQSHLFDTAAQLVDWYQRPAQQR